MLVLSGVGPVQASAQRNGSWPLGQDPSPGSTDLSLERSEGTMGGLGLYSHGPAFFGLEAAGGLTPVRVAVPGLSPSSSPAEFRAGVAPTLVYRSVDPFPRTRRAGLFDLVAVTGVRVPLSSQLDLRMDAENHLDGLSLARDGGAWTGLVFTTQVGLQLGRDSRVPARTTDQIR